MQDTRTSIAVAVVLASVVGLAALTGAVAGAAGATASIIFDDQRGANEVTVQSVTLPDGGYVVVKNESGDVVSHSDYLEAGTYENVTVEVSPAFERSQVAIAEAHADDGDATWDNATVDGGYADANNFTVSDTAFVTVPGDEVSRTSPTPTVTATATAGPTESPGGAESTPTASDTETTTEGPGFGIAVALVALVAAVALIRRR